MSGYQGDSKLVSSEYLYNQFKGFNQLREKKLDKALFVTTEAHYELASVQDGSEGKEVVDDGNVTLPDTQIEISSVTPFLPSDHVVSIGEYVVFIDEVKEDIYLKKSSLDVETEDLDLTTL